VADTRLFDGWVSEPLPAGARPGPNGVSGRARTGPMAGSATERRAPHPRARCRADAAIHFAGDRRAASSGSDRDSVGACRRRRTGGRSRPSVDTTGGVLGDGRAISARGWSTTGHRPEPAPRACPRTPTPFDVHRSASPRGSCSSEVGSTSSLRHVRHAPARRSPRVALRRSAATWRCHPRRSSRVLADRAGAHASRGWARRQPGTWVRDRPDPPIPWSRRTPRSPLRLRSARPEGREARVGPRTHVRRRRARSSAAPPARH
jgi:hypothetical protein